MSIYKPIQTGSTTFQKNIVGLPQTNLFGSALKFSKADRTNLSGSFYGNLFNSFNLPVTIEQKQNFTTGIYANTGFQYLNQDKVIVAEVPKNAYGELIDGKSISFTILTTGGTVNIYSTFLQNSLINTAGHMLYSDPSTQSSQFGQNLNLTELPGQSGLANPITGYSSNIAYLYSDSIQKPQNNSNYSWSSNSIYFVNENNLPSGLIGTKFAANYSSADGVVDIPVGIAYLDKGFMVITHPTLVNSFNFTAATFNGSPYVGDANFANIYFTGSTSLIFNSFNTEYIQNSVCIGLPNEFYQSNNPTFNEAYGPDNIGNNPVAITEVALYNSNMECIAIAKTNAPIPKTKSSVINFNITINI